MRKLLSILCTAILAFSMVSCLGDSEDPEYTQQMTYTCYNKIVHTSESSTVNATLGKYEFDFNFTAATVGLKAYVSLNPGDATIPLDLGTMKLSVSQSDNSYNFTANNVDVSYNGATYSITNFVGKIATYSATSGGQQTAVSIVTLSFYVNGVYRVDALDPQPYYFSNATITTDPNGNTYSTSDTQYKIAFTASKDKADITLYQAKFMEQMPAQTFVLKDVPVTYTLNGYELKAERIVPEINDTPFEQFALSNFSMTTSEQGRSMGISFGCNYNNTLYTISAIGSVIPSSSN